MVIVVFKCIRVIESRVVVFHNDGFPLGSVPQTLSYWGHSSFPAGSGSSLTLHSLIMGLVCQEEAFFVGCQFLACAFNG